jgi:phosphotriesterase-related protein
VLLQTVLGPIDVADMQRTLVHEHVIIGYPGDELDPTGSFDRAECVAVAVDRLQELITYGVTTFIDPCPMELGRDPELMAEISQKSGMNIVCATGFYLDIQDVGSGSIPMGIPSYWRMRTSEEIAELYLSEINEGIGSTGIRPGVVKIASGDPPTAAEERVLRGAAMAAAESGLTVISHCENSVGGEFQQRIMKEYGVPLGRCLIGHQGQQPIGSHEIAEIAERGSFVGIDRIGCEIICKDENLAAHAMELVKMGYTDQICFSQDHWCYPRAPRFPYPMLPGSSEVFGVPVSVAVEQTYGRSHSYLFSSFLPRILEMGLPEEKFESILRDNPRRLFGG